MPINNNYHLPGNASSLSSPSSSAHITTIPPKNLAQFEHERDDAQRESVAQIAARLSQGEDFRLATKLQEEEFQSHFTKNRNQRLTVASDAKLSREEDRRTMEERKKGREEIILRDEAMARELERQFIEEEHKKAEEQAKRDEELARKLQMEQQEERRGGRKKNEL